MKNFNINKNWVVVGKVLKSHGTTGLFKIISYCQEPSSIFDYQPIILKCSRESIALNLKERKISPKNNQFTAKILSSKNMETSKSLIGEKLLANKKKFHNPLENNFFYSDLEGCKVLDSNKKYIGKIVGVFNFGAGDILEIKKMDNSTLMINFNKKNFPDISIKEKIIIANF